MIFKYLLMAWFALSILTALAVAGKPRGPLSHGTAVIMVVIYSAFILAIALYWETP